MRSVDWMVGLTKFPKHLLIEPTPIFYYSADLTSCEAEILARLEVPELNAQYRSTQSRAYFLVRLGLNASLQARAEIHFETAMRQDLLHSQIEHWPLRSVPVSVVTGPDLTQQSS